MTVINYDIETDIALPATAVLPEYDYMAHTWVIDISRWQGEMDFEKAKAQGIKAVCIRCTVGDYYQDTLFIENWKKAKAAGLLVSAYHVVTPEISAERQITNFLITLGMRVPDFQLVLDCELDRDQSSQTITNVIKGCANLIAEAGFDVMIYTGVWWWNQYVGRRDYWKDYPLWVAQYNEHIDEPSLPHDWDTWELWQYTSKGDGPTYGSTSKSIDLNRVRDPEFFNFDNGDNGGDQVSDADKLQEFDDAIKVAQANGVEPEVKINYQVGAEYSYVPPSNGNGGDPGTDPPPVDPPDPGYQLPGGYGWANVKDKCHAMYYKDKNNAGKPIMISYPTPTDNAKRDRIFFEAGDKVAVKKTSIQADGGAKYHLLDNEQKLVDDQADNRDLPELYIWKEKFSKTW